MRAAIWIGFMSLTSSACLVGNGPEGTTDQEIKGRNKMFASQRPPHNKVAVFDQAGDEKQSLVGDANLQIPFGVHVEGDDIYVVNQRGTGMPPFTTPSGVYAHIHRPGESASEHHALTELVANGGGDGTLVGAFYPTVRDGVLYVSAVGTNRVNKFDALTGANQGAYVIGDPLTNGLAGPRGLDFDSQGNLFVASSGNGKVIKFAPNGTATEFATGIPTPCGLAVDAYDRLCVGSANPTMANGVTCFNADGTSFYNSGVGRVCGLDWGRDGKIYITRTDLMPTTVEVHDFTNPGVTFATVPAVAGLSWGTD